MTTISYKNGNSWVTATPVIVLTQTHLMGSAQNTHVPIIGGDGLGYTFIKGRDNAVCTINCLIPWTSTNMAILDKLNGKPVKIEDSVEGTHYGVGTVTLSNSDNHAWVSFVLSFTEDSKEV